MAHYAELNMELLDEVVLSSRSATVGEHQSLDYIPGSTLLGWAASKLYKQLTSEQAFVVFHSGQVRFGNGLPLNGVSEKTHPMPLCWHEDKGGASALSNGRLDASKLFNMAHGKPDGLKQPRQMRKGYIAWDGAVVQPLKAYRMKTAIDPATGTAAESQLFGFESLQRGQRFAAGIAADDSVPVELFVEVLKTFAQTIRIGRSRSAQYGRVKTEVIRDAAPVMPEVSGHTNLTLWLQSDMAVRDKNGMPTLLPDNPAVFGLPAGKLNIEKSFVRFRSYAPYNAHHHCYESDRQVIVAGSVLHYEFDTPLTAVDAALLAGGLGIHREAGLGAVCVNHVWLQDKKPKFADPKSNNNPARKTITHPLIQFLERKARQIDEERDAKNWAEKKCAELEGIYQSARRYKGVPPGEPIGPGRTQWRRVQEAIMKEEHIAALFDETNGVCKSKDEDWSQEYSAGQTFRSWMETVVGRIPGDINLVLHIQWLARKAEALREAGMKEKKQ